MTTYMVLRHSALGLIIGSLLVALSGYNAWAMHEKVQCRSCHVFDAEAKDGVAKDLLVPRNTICLSCHDAQQDFSGLGTPHVINGQKKLAGGSFTATLDSDNSGHNMLTIDEDLGLTPPGGMPQSEFNCLSCHDPHINGNYRNLKTEINGRATLISARGDANFEKNLYISGINNFCGACHQRFADGPAGGNGGSWRRHPVGITI